MQPGETRRLHNSRRTSLLRPSIVVGALLLLAAVVIFWTNQRRQSSWERYKRSLTAKGETLDWSAYLPPPPPSDEENFAATPLLRAVGRRDRVDPMVWGRFSALGLESQMSHLGDWAVGLPADLAAIQVFLRNRPVNSLPAGPQGPAQDILDVLEPVGGELNELRAASARPQARLDLRYLDPVSADRPNFVAFRSLAQLLSLRASAELALGNSADALADLRVVHRLADLCASDPTLVSAMIATAIRGLGVQAFWEGWVSNRWSDTQLAELQGIFAAPDLLDALDRALRAERAGIVQIVEQFENQQLANTLVPATGTKSWQDRVAEVAVRFSPRGWRAENLLNYCRRLEENAFVHYDVRTGRVFAGNLEKWLAAPRKLPSVEAPFNYLSAIAVPNVGRAIETVARNQTALNLAMLACALESYRRVYGSYPETLEELVPRFVSKLPHDLITGKQLSYRLTADGSFLLYSVGWNETDDAGRTDRKMGDWTWPVKVSESK